jgi:hypothetical protein
VRIRIQRGALKSALRSTQWVLAAAGILMLGYCGLVMADAWIFQKKQSRHFEQLMYDRQTAGGASSRTVSIKSSPFAQPVPAGGLVGRIEIPRLLSGSYSRNGPAGTTG